MAQAVSDIGSNAQENIAHAAKIIGRSKHRQSIFNAIYTGKQRVKRVSKLMEVTSLSRKRVLDAGKALADDTLVNVKKINGETGYEKIDFFHRHKDRILSLASSPAKLNTFPTKRNPVSHAGAINLRISVARAQIGQISIDDIASFQKAWNLEATGVLGDKISEAGFKAGIKKLIGEAGEFKDWGGEVSDLYTSRLKISKKRVPVAVALKGPATKGKLTPGKMGKNGDQLQRLFEAPADIFLVQYCRQIDQAVITQMERLAVAKSVLTGKRVFYGVIDGQDSRRIFEAYPGAFKSRRR